MGFLSEISNYLTQQREARLSSTPRTHSFVRILICFIYPIFVLHRTVLKKTVVPIGTNIEECRFITKKETGNYGKMCMLPNDTKNEDLGVILSYLSHWVALAFVMGFFFLIDPFMNWLPCYDFIKTIIYVWTMYSKGGLILYRMIIAPFLNLNVDPAIEDWSNTIFNFTKSKASVNM